MMRYSVKANMDSGVTQILASSAGELRCLDKSLWLAESQCLHPHNGDNTPLRVLGDL